jgi:hypothetical protein
VREIDYLNFLAMCPITTLIFCACVGIGYPRQPAKSRLVRGQPRTGDAVTARPRPTPDEQRISDSPDGVSNDARKVPNSANQLCEADRLTNSLSSNSTRQKSESNATDPHHPRWDVSPSSHVRTYAQHTD